jgi:hypothetical protein
MKFSEVLAASGYYVPGKEGDTGKQSIKLGGKDYDLSPILYSDIKILGDEMDTLIANMNPIIQNLIAKNALAFLDAVRMANVESKQGFKGALGSGNELDIQFLGPRQFHDPDAVAATRRASWVRTITAAMVTYRDCPYINDLTSGIFAPPAVPAEVELAMTQYESLIIVGFVNDAATPCSNGVQITMNTAPYDIQDMDFEMAQPLEGCTLWELKEPWLLPPLQSGWVHLRYFRAGTDECKPVGAWVRMARLMRAL